MSLLKNFKRAIGLSNDEDIEDLNDESLQEDTSDIHTSAPIHPLTSSEEFKFSEDVKLQIFERVVTIFNDTLPAFLKSSIDADAQKKYLFQALDQSIKDYLEKIDTRVKEQVEAEWSEERNNLRNEMSALKDKTREIEEKRSEVKQQQLSAERQKRALSERVHDLESQVLKLEADAEQYDIENKSLINKLKIANLHDKDLEDMRSEVERLQKALLEQRNASSVQPTEQLESGSNAELEALRESMENDNNKLKEENKLLADEISKLNSDNSTLSVQNTSLNEENTKLKSALNQLEVKARMGDEMINDLNKRASDALHNLTAKEKELADVKERLEFANNELEIAAEIQGEIEKFEAIKKKKDNKISNLKKQVAELQAQNEILRKEKQPEIDRTELPDVDNEGFDSSLDDVDWFVSPEPEPQKPRQNDDFGYQEPPRKPQPPENDAQLLLW